ncbi:unnamed protein product [Closterium sp. Naga37s-1]|nr:unnamed protein product [Closterium sp. Naga37s-1]
MPVALGDEMHYPPLPFVAVSAVAAPPVVSASARAAAEMSPHHAPLPAPPAALAPATVEAPPPAVKSAPAVPPPEVPNLAAPLGVSAPDAAPVPLVPSAAPVAPAPPGGFAAHPGSVPGAPAVPAASVPGVPAPESSSSPKAASATTGGPAPMVAPPAVDSTAPVVLQAGPVAQTSRPLSPDRRQSRPHSPVPQQERESSRRRRNSPRRYQQQAQWSGHPGGNGGWRGPRGRGGGGAYRPPVTLADLQREVSRAVREERAAQSQSSSLRAAPAHVAPPPAASAPAPGSRLRLPPVPPVAGVEFVAVGGGAAGAQHTPYPAADDTLSFLAVALQPPQTRVPESTLGQLHRLAESLHALLLIQVLAHASLPPIPADSFRDRRRETCLDAADQLAQLLAPALAAPAEGGAAAVGQLDEAVRGLRRHLRAGSGAAAIGASTLVVRELWRTLTGILHALGAHRM